MPVIIPVSRETFADALVVSNRSCSFAILQQMVLVMKEGMHVFKH